MPLILLGIGSLIAVTGAAVYFGGEGVAAGANAVANAQNTAPTATNIEDIMILGGAAFALYLALK